MVVDSESEAREAVRHSGPPVEACDVAGRDERHPPRRRFQDASGAIWTVFERSVPKAEWTTADEESARAGYAAGWLWFETAGRHPRRLRLYPAHWARLGDAALDALRGRARELPDASD